MKSRILSMLMIVICSVSAYAGPVDSLIDQFTSSKGPEYICRKAKLTDLTFSIRSASGVACKNTFVAAAAEIICTEKDFDDYANSGCHKNAIKALDGKTPKDALVAEAKKLGLKATKSVCIAASASLPLLLPVCLLIQPK